MQSILIWCAVTLYHSACSSSRVLVSRIKANGTRTLQGEAETSQRQRQRYNACPIASFAEFLIPRVTPPSFPLWLILAKSQLTKANQNKTRFENVARELQKVRAMVLHRFEV